MRDEQLREELAAWLRPAQQAEPPHVSLIRRRLRRRRARGAVAGVALCALAAGSVLAIRTFAAPHPPVHGGPGPRSAAACSAGHLHVGWSPTPALSSGFSQEPLPVRYLLVFRNTGRARCSMEGWPRLTITRPPMLRTVTISYGTVSVLVARRGPVARVVEPTRVTLRSGASAVAAMTVSLPLDMVNCGRPGWSVTPPHGRASTALAGSPEAILPGSRRGRSCSRREDASTSSCWASRALPASR